MRNIFFKPGVSFFVTLFVFLIAQLEVYSQVIFFPTKVINFIPDNTDSVFIFAENLAVTASGTNLERLLFKYNEIHGEDIPPTLKLSNPIGAILYHQNYANEEIPVIINRLDKKIPLDRLVREYFLNISNFKGRSEKGGIKIAAWEKEIRRKSFLIFLQDGRILGSDDKWLMIPTKNFSQFEIKILPIFENQIAGVWINPPDIGVNQVTAEILRLLQSGPLLIEYWDGLSWQFFEQAWLSQVIEGDLGNARMAFSLFPPETEINYSAMVAGGLIDISEKHNLFTALNWLGIEYEVFEGEKLFFSIPAKVKMHTGNSPEQKDAEIFHSALLRVKNSSPPLLLLHYYGLDELNHSVGPHDPRTVIHFQKLWDWHNQLRKHWQGNLLIVSDHGAHHIEDESVSNQKFLTKGTRGTHGDFIFSDMAVPIIIQTGLGKNKGQFKLAKERAEQIWNMIGASLALDEEKSEDQPGELKIIIAGQMKIFTIEQHADVFSKEFYFDYLKKGKPFKGYFKGLRLIDLLNGVDPASIKQIIAYSFDGQQVAFSNDDLLNNELVVGLKSDDHQPAEAFTLYPLKDKFPNRMMKQLQRIKLY